jgi:hypothetical protein
MDLDWLQCDRETSENCRVSVRKACQALERFTHELRTARQQRPSSLTRSASEDSAGNSLACASGWYGRVPPEREPLKFPAITVDASQEVQLKKEILPDSKIEITLSAHVLFITGL